MFRFTKLNSLSFWLVLLSIFSTAIVPGYSTKGVGTKAYQEAGHKYHNGYRSLHDVDPLESDSTLDGNAEKCAQHYADIKTIDHSCPHKNGAGENLFWSSVDAMDADIAVKQACDGWYNEIKDYDFKKNSAKDGKTFGHIGHFTQLVWKGSKKLGTGLVSKEGAGTFVVALYDPPGNYNNMYKENVMPPKNGARSLASSNGTSSAPIGTKGQNDKFVLWGKMLITLGIIATGF